MHTSKLTTLLIAASLTLPVAAFSQASSSPGTSPRQTNPGQTTQPREQGSSQLGHAAGVATGAQITRVSEDKLKGHLTAERIVGKQVVDNQGQKIGKIKAVGLSQVIEKQGKRDRATAGAGSSASSTSGGAATSRAMTGGQEVQVYISADAALNLGSDLLVIPASQLSVNADNDEFRLQMSRDAIRSVAQVSSSQR